VFIDARSVPNKKVIQTDVCIVGAGPAGITAARELAGQPFQVCILESGGREFDAYAQAFAEAENAGLPYWPLRYSRLRLFGGSSEHWGGWSTPLDDIDFQVRDWVPYSGWPFDKSHLDPYYERAQTVCRLGPYRYDAEFWQRAEHWPDGRERPPVALPKDRVETRIFQVRALRFGQAYADEIGRAGNITVYLHANVVTIEATRNARAVTRLAVACVDGPRFFVAAKVFILATGGIENARLLLVSNGAQAGGLGNQHDLVGRFFMEHPYVESGLFLPSALENLGDLYKGGPAINDGPYVVGVWKLSEDLVRREKLLNQCCVFGKVQDDSLERNEAVVSLRYLGRALRRGERPTDFWKHLGNVLGDIDAAGRAAYRLARDGAPLVQTVFYFSTQAEQAPNPDSRVTLSAQRDVFGQPLARLEWRFIPLDKRSMRRSQEVVGQALGQAGLARVQVTIDEDDEGWSTAPASGAQWTGPRGAYHHLGTTRMHDDATRGVVDKNCRVHGLSNLFIAGGSVFPTGGFSNPTLTIVALAIRLADHVKRLMRS
jgi:choline dehydrogenase-like flavoprotein